METLYGKRLPVGVRIGEAWELVDREEAQSVVHEGLLRGKTLHELWRDHRETVFGARYQGREGRFPLLFKLLDAEERLSVQVHPPASVAGELKGEPKTEMWYVAQARPEADLYVGLQEGTTRDGFARALHEGKVDRHLHRIRTRSGDAMMIPSGRVHAIGAGNLIVEVQQNSDTTYRVFDWNRLGLDGKPRALHVAQSMRSIDFNDFEPALQPRGQEPLVACEHFKVCEWKLENPREGAAPGDFAVFAVLSGRVECAGKEYPAGQFFLLPAALTDRTLTPREPETVLLRTVLP